MIYLKSASILFFSLLMVSSCQINDGLADDDFVTIDNYSIEIDNLPIKIKVGSREVIAYLSKKEGSFTDVVLGLHSGGKNIQESRALAKDYYKNPQGGQAFLNAGFALLSLQYTEFDGSEILTRGEKELEDILAAVDFMLSDGLSDNNVRFERVFVAGHSRGAGNALLAGIERKVDGVIASAGTLDWIAMQAAIEDGSIEMTIDELDFFKFSTEDWGSSAETPSPWTENSPALRVSEFQSPFLVIAGTNDTRVPVASAYQMQTRYDDCSTCIGDSKFVIHEQGHTDWNTEAVIEQVMTFIE